MWKLELKKHIRSQIPQGSRAFKTMSTLITTNLHCLCYPTEKRPVSASSNYSVLWLLSARQEMLFIAKEIHSIENFKKSS
jgi:hypothetical protein